MVLLPIACVDLVVGLLHAQTVEMIKMWVWMNLIPKTPFVQLVCQWDNVRWLTSWGNVNMVEHVGYLIVNDINIFKE